MIYRGWHLVLQSILFTFLLLTPVIASAEDKIRIGLVEDVILLPSGVKIPARIDTGAATSSLDARELKIHDNIAEFKLPQKYGGSKLTLPVVGWKTIRSAESRERRPIVEMELCVGPKRLLIQVNLNDRSMVKYPLILGRNVLKKNFVVDCMHQHCLPPSCSEGSLK